MHGHLRTTEVENEQDYYKGIWFSREGSFCEQIIPNRFPHEGIPENDAETETAESESHSDGSIDVDVGNESTKSDNNSQPYVNEELVEMSSDSKHGLTQGGHTRNLSNFRTGEDKQVIFCTKYLNCICSQLIKFIYFGTIHTTICCDSSCLFVGNKACKEVSR